jgi:cell division protein ZapD
MKNLQLYEFPFNNKMRVFLRIEAYFEQIEYHLKHLHKWDIQTCLSSLMELFKIIENNDLKNIFTKELDKHYASLSVYTKFSSINTHKLTSILAEIEEATTLLNNTNNRLSRDMIESDPLLNNARQKIFTGATINPFDIPSYYYWLQQPALVCEQKIREWLKHLEPIKICVRLLLEITRESCLFETKISNNGFYQQILNAQTVCQLIRLQIQEGGDYFPEVSGSKHRVNIRFLTYSDVDSKPIQTFDDIKFHVAACCM